jgi:glycoside hydrolase-like protein
MHWSTRMAVPILTVALACSNGAPEALDQTLATLSASVPDVPHALADLSGSPMLQEVTDNGPYLGFDTSDYPGDGAMATWREHAGYDWVGYYLQAPCHKDASWSGKRDTLEAMGWGMAVVYVGQQTWGKTPRATGRTSRGTTCAANLVNSAQGRLDADDAIARTMAEGFPSGTAIFLDLERMNSVPNAMREYYLAWTERLLDDGRFRPAYYAHNANAQTVYADVRALLDRQGIEADPPFWIAGGSNFGRDRDPQEVGHEFADVWQGVLDTWEKHATVRLPIDVNVAAVPSPSAAQYASAD